VQHNPCWPCAYAVCSGDTNGCYTAVECASQLITPSTYSNTQRLYGHPPDMLCCGCGRACICCCHVCWRLLTWTPLHTALHNSPLRHKDPHAPCAAAAAARHEADTITFMRQTELKEALATTPGYTSSFCTLMTSVAKSQERAVLATIRAHLKLRRIASPCTPYAGPDAS
jgi:hypothetical protein